MGFQPVADRPEFAVQRRHQLFKGRLVGARRDAPGFRDRLRRTDAGHDIFALRVHQELAVERLLAGGRITGKGNARRRGRAEIAEHHGLDVHRRTPMARDLVQVPIGDGARIHPAGKHTADRAPELGQRILRKGEAQFVLDHLLVEPDDMLPFGASQFRVEIASEACLFLLEDLLEDLVIEAHHDIGIHLDETAIAVPGKARIAGIARECLDGRVVEPEVEDGVHHARHGGAGAGAHGEKQRAGSVSEATAGLRLQHLQRFENLALQRGSENPSFGMKAAAGLGNECKSGRHRQSERGHFRQIGALATQNLPVDRASLGLAAAERIDPLGHACSPPIPCLYSNRDGLKTSPHQQNAAMHHNCGGWAFRRETKVDNCRPRRSGAPLAASFTGVAPPGSAVRQHLGCQAGSHRVFRH